MAKETNAINPQVINLIAKGTQITGNLISDGDFRIDGEVLDIDHNFFFVDSHAAPDCIYNPHICLMGNQPG